MLGGGTFTLENKVLPGSYINIVSTDNGADLFGERGITAMGIIIDWGFDGITEITKEEFILNSEKYFARPYTDSYIKDIREAFMHSSKLLIYKLNCEGHKKASCAYCTAKGYGTRGNFMKFYALKNVDDPSSFDVKLTLEDKTVFSQTVKKMSELAENNYVEWTRTVSLSVVQGTALTGGVTGELTGEAVQNFLKLLEGYSFNAVTIIHDSEEYESLLIEYTKRMRDEAGKKFQCVTSLVSGDHEGNVYIKAELEGTDSYHLLAWTAGAVGGCAVNKSLTNMLYDGAYRINTDASQTELEESIKKGEFVFHNVNGDTRVLLDINSLVSTTQEKGNDFKDNQTVRVVDQIATDIAAIFNGYYLGRVPNDAAGRNSLWCDIVKHHEKLLELRAIDGFDENAITVERGENKRSVRVTDIITPANAMTQLYMTVRIN